MTAHSLANSAFEAALHLASRSLAAIDLIGIFGFSDSSGEPAQSNDDYQWQKDG